MKRQRADGTTKAQRRAAAKAKAGLRMLLQHQEAWKAKHPGKELPAILRSPPQQ